MKTRWITVLRLLVAWGLASGAVHAAEHEVARPNYVVIVIDDLNDWVGRLATHPQVQTPHLDRLAERGLFFTNAHVQAAFCGPSRISFLSGRMPSTTGCFGFEPRYDQAESLRDHPPFPLFLRRTGYTTFGGGKIFHTGTGQGWVADCWETVWPVGENPQPPEAIHMPGKPYWDWGPWPERDDQMGDFQLAQKAAAELGRSHDNPFLITVGFHRPHVPLHVPQKWFDLYSENEVVLPVVPADDLDDVPHPEYGTENHLAPSPEWLREKGLTKSLVQAYLASISFVDHCVGEVMDALAAGPNAENTVVILFSDHGFHLGEKQHWAKRTLWEETTRIPFIVAGPGIPAGAATATPVSLIDLYPTLCELSGEAAPRGLEGESLVPLLRNPATPMADRMAFTTFRAGEHSVRTRDWRYIRYPDGSEELYDHRNDPNEWHNLAGKSAHAEELTRLRDALSQRFDR